MKKLISICLIIVAICSLVFSFAGCNLILNDGSEDEVEGIYGFSSMAYRFRKGSLKDYKDYNFNFADKYDYFVVVLRDDKTGTEYIKAVDGEEQKYDFTYSLIFDDEDTDVVDKIVLENFVRPIYTYVSETECRIAFEAVPSSEFVFHPKTEKFNISAAFSGTREFLVFEKMYNTTKDARIEKAKTKLTDSREDRASSTDSDEE